MPLEPGHERMAIALDSMRAVVEAMVHPAVLIRPDERILAASDSARTLLGQGLVGRHFITALRQPGLLDAVENCLRDGVARRADYLTNDGQQGSSFRVSISPVPFEARTGVLVTFEDVTHLEQVGQMRRDFVANVSHELRTPLTAVIGFIETLRGPARDDAATRDRFLAIMEREAARMNRLVGDLLSLSRVEAEERVRPTERLDPADLIRSTLHGLVGLAQEAGVTLQADLPQDGFTMLGDADQLRQVLTNLCENGIKYSGRGTSVTVSLTEPSYEARLRCEGVRITVADTGAGIEEHHLPRLTERFYRVDGHRSREMGGTGLGLAIVKHIVNRHRGRLKVDSAPGEGTRFLVLLPIS